MTPFASGEHTSSAALRGRRPLFLLADVKSDDAVDTDSQQNGTIRTSRPRTEIEEPDNDSADREDATDAIRELRKEVQLLSQTTSALGDKVSRMAEGIKELQDHVEYYQEVDVEIMDESLRDARRRLTVVEELSRKMEAAMRSDARKGIAEVREYVKQQKQQDGVHVENQVDDDDAKSTASVSLRAETLLQHLEDAGSDVGSVVSRASRFW